METTRKERFEARFKQHYSRLCNIAYGYVADRDDCEDLVQELFINVWNKGKDSMPEKDFALYMTTSIKNSCISFLRKKHNSEVSIEDHPSAAITLANDDDWSDERRSPEEMLEQALAVLPPKCKEVFLMAKLKGMKYREIAESLQISEKTVENQMTKAIRQLREFVSGTPLSLMAFIVLVLTFIFNCD